MTIVILKTLFNDCALRGFGINLQNAFAINIVLSHRNITDMNLRTSIKIHLASNSSKAPEVLVLKIRTVTPTHNLHGNEVLTFFQVLGNIKLGCHLGIFTITDIPAIDPQRKVTRSRTYMKEDILTIPIGRQFECTAIRSRVIIGFTDERWIGLEGRTPSITYVFIDFITIALNLKESGHGKINPV